MQDDADPIIYEGISWPMLAEITQMGNSLWKTTWLIDNDVPHQAGPLGNATSSFWASPDSVMLQIESASFRLPFREFMVEFMVEIVNDKVIPRASTFSLFASNKTFQDFKATSESPCLQ